MATTTNYSWTTPDDTALVKDGAAAIRSLGTAIDSTVFTNAGAAVAKATVDAKGDLIAGTADNTVGRLAVGANGTTLVADSGETTGLKWATPAATIPANSYATVLTSEVTSSTSYTNLTTAGPAVTVTTGTKALVIVTANLRNDAVAGTVLRAFMGYEVTGATSVSPSDNYALASSPINGATDSPIQTSLASVVTLTAGSNTFTAKYKSSSGVSTFTSRTIFVINLA
jgi:hypothetical protein